MWAQGGRAVSRGGLSCCAAGVPKFKLSLNLDGVSVGQEGGLSGLPGTEKEGEGSRERIKKKMYGSLE